MEVVVGLVDQHHAGDDGEDVRSNGGRVSGRLAGAGREVRNAIVVGWAGIRTGRSCSVFTVQRSTPHSIRPLDGEAWSKLAAAAAMHARTTANTARARTD
jgi:hypothetical protein